MSYPPQGGPQDPYNLNQPQQPGGPVPGPSGQGYQFDGPQPQYTQPEHAQQYQQDPYGQQQGYPQPNPAQQGYPQPQYTDPYGGYGPPPVQATTKSSSGGIILVVVVVLLMAAGGVAGYLLLGDRGGSGSVAGGDTTTSPAADDETTDSGPDDEDEVPPGDGLVVEPFGANTPLPEGDWEARKGPGEAEDFAVDAHSVWISHTEVWGSLFYVGRLNAVDIVYDSSDLAGTATDVVTAWSSHFSRYTEGLEITPVETTEHTIDGRPAVLAEATVSWDSVESDTEDDYERIAVLLVDVDGANAFVGVASIAQSGDDHYDAAIEALLATTFA